jgi:hypothetical protein
MNALTRGYAGNPEPPEGGVTPLDWRLGVVILGGAVRLWLWWNSLGTFDTDIWARHAGYIHEYGLAAAYRAIAIVNQPFNHPPLAGWWAAFALNRGRADSLLFARWMRLPGLLADLAAMAALWHWRSPLSAAMYALAPVAILVSAYHGNTDAACALGILLAALALERGSWLAAGLALAFAVNVKVIPLLFLPAALAALPDRRARTRFAAGFAVAVIPFIPLALTATSAMARNILGYSPAPYEWGLTTLLPADAASWYGLHGKTVVALAAVALALAAWRQKWKPARAFAATAALFLLLAPGFGPQYLIYPLAPLLVADALAGAVWAAFAGGFACALYGTGCAGIWPYSTWLPTPMLEVVRNCGVAAWAALALGGARICRTTFGR